MSDKLSEILLEKYPITNTDWSFNRSTASLMTYIKITTNSVRLNKASLKLTLDFAKQYEYFYREIPDLTNDERQIDPWNRRFPNMPGRLNHMDVIAMNRHIKYEWNSIINHEGNQTYHFIYTTSLEGIKILCIDRLTDI
jgi:hypothetical protein